MVRSVSVFDLEGNIVGSVELPAIFDAPVRVDLIRRAVLALMTSKLQPKGTDPLAGLRTTAESWGVGHGVARVPRVKGSSRAARVPQAVKGRRAHPPRVEKKIREFINEKEKRLATVSALAATANLELVRARGHRVERVKQIPLVVVDDFQRLTRASDVRKVLDALGLWADVERAVDGTRIRAGKGKMRGRRYKVPKSLLIVVAENEGIVWAARNLPGVEVATARLVNVAQLAPGGHPGRLTLYTLSSLKILAERFEGVTVWNPMAL
ncbi:MAG: 50S ribosomal protein L4 [Thermofilaceae archaeon]